MLQLTLIYRTKERTSEASILKIPLNQPRDNMSKMSVDDCERALYVADKIPSFQSMYISWWIKNVFAYGDSLLTFESRDTKCGRVIRL